MPLRGVTVLAVDQRLRADRNGYIEIPAHFHAEKFGRRNPHNLNGTPIQRHPLSQHLRIAAKFPLPKRVADHRSGRSTSWNVVIFANQAAHQRPHAQRLEKLTDAPKGLRKTGFAANRQIKAAVAPGKDAGEGLLMLANLLPQRIGEVWMSIREISGTAMLILGDLQFRKLLRMRNRKHAQPHRIQQLKDGGVSTDSQRERNGCDGKKARIHPQQAGAIMEILPQSFQQSAWVHVSGTIDMLTS